VAASGFERRYLILRLAESAGSFLLLIAGFIVLGATGNPTLGLLLMGAGFLIRIVLSRYTRRLVVEAAQKSYVDSGGSRWWYDSRTGQVAQAALRPAPQFDGPYAGREDAERAPEIARQRAAAWNAEDD